MTNAMEIWYYERLVDAYDWETKWWVAGDEEDARTLASNRDHEASISVNGVTGRYRVRVVNEDGTGYTHVFDTDPRFPTLSYDPKNPTEVQRLLKDTESYPMRGRNGFIRSAGWLKTLLSELTENVSLNVMDIEHMHSGDTTHLTIKFGVTLSREESGMPVSFELRDKSVN